MLEPYASGHHAPYILWMVQGIINEGINVTVVTSTESMAHPCMQQLVTMSENQVANQGSLKVNGEILSSGVLGKLMQSGTFGHIARESFFWCLFRTWFLKYSNPDSPDVVFLPYLDYCLYGIGLFGSPFAHTPWTGVAMRPSFHFKDMGITTPQSILVSFKKILFFRLLKNATLTCLLTIDETLNEYVNTRYPQQFRMSFLPEPVQFENLPDTISAKKEMGLSSNRLLILVYGSITLRKGVAELLNALNKADFPDNVDVMLAGKISPPIKAKISELWVESLITKGRLIVLDRFISKNEESAVFAASDMVWLGYRNHYTPSGVLLQAAAAGKPILASDKGVIAWQVRKYNLGRIVNSSPESIISAIKASLVNLSGSCALIGSPSNAGCNKSLSEVSKVIRNALEKKCK